MKNRSIALCAAVALLATACGSRLSDSDLAAGAGTGGGGSPATTAPSSGGGPNGPTFGTMDAPCGPAPDGGITPVDGVQGVTADSIRIGVISDKAGIVKVPTASVEESVKAFVNYCNELGGIAGRTLDLKTYDAQLTAADVAATEACNDGLFSLVGTGVVQDDKMAQVLVDCDLLNVAGYTATGAASLSDLTYSALPNPFIKFNTAPSKWIASQHPDAVTKAGILSSNLPVANLQADRVVDATTKASGYDFVYDRSTEIIQTTYSGEVAEMRDEGVEYMTMVSATSETAKLLKDMTNAGWRPEVIDLGQQYYDTDLLEVPGAEGAYVQSNTVPFEEAEAVPAMQQFLAEYDKVDADVPATSLGVQAFSAGLLFATAATAASLADTGLTRDAMIEQIESITEWDSGGLHFTTSPGTNESAPCFLYLQVEDGAFVRAFPEEPGTFECTTPDDMVDVDVNP